MTSRDDEASNFNRNLGNLQDRAEHGDNERLDQSPLAIADEIRAVYAKAKETADVEETFTEKHYERSRRNGVDAAESLSNMGDWYNGLINPNTTAKTAAQLRTYGIGAPPRPKLPDPVPEPENEHMADMIKRVAIPEAAERAAKRDALRRAQPNLRHIVDAHGSEAPAVINKMGEIWDMVLDKPVEAPPKVINIATQEQHAQLNRALQLDAGQAWLNKHPEVKNNPELRERMAALQPWARSAANVGDALNAALAEAKGQRYLNENERRDDAERDTALATIWEHGRKVGGW